MDFKKIVNAPIINKVKDAASDATKDVLREAAKEKLEQAKEFVDKRLSTAKPEAQQPETWQSEEQSEA